MALWKIEPTFKKSLIDINYWENEKGQTIRHETGWRWGEFFIRTEDDTPPDLPLNGGFDILSCGYDLEDWSTDDGCWEDYEFDGFDEDEETVLQEWIDENSIFDLEDKEGERWIATESEMMIECPITIEKVEE